MGDYRKLLVWQRAYHLTLAVYRATRRFPTSERFGLSAQLQRATVSVVANIAEGAGRGSEKELTRFLWIARGSLTETIAELSIARDLGYLNSEDAGALIGMGNDVGRLLTGLLKARGAIPQRRTAPLTTND
ncbi:MAG: four helix bundle protein [Gemmatimonadetes bacterium]|nr:four helix bundle protein [Gemmatimonadota bacterium]